MRLMVAAFVVLGLLGPLTDKSVGPGDVTITIDKITANDKIRGRVRGLTGTDPQAYKVLVYVHTDLWYVHPWAGQGKGRSWAAVENDGSWRLKSLQREFKANKIAALVVRRSYPEPHRLADVRSIPHEAIVIKDLVGTPDFGKV